MVERRGVRGKRERRGWIPSVSLFTIPSLSFILLSSFSSFEREGRKVEKDEGGRWNGGEERSEGEEEEEGEEVRGWRRGK